jgi:hypothetical protein
MGIFPVRTERPTYHDVRSQSFSNRHPATRRRSDEQKPLHSEFDGSQILLDTLYSAIPDFDLSQLSLNPLEEGKGSIVFTGEVDLDKRELAILGLS